MKTPCKHGDWKDLPRCRKSSFVEQGLKDVLANVESLKLDLENLEIFSVDVLAKVIALMRDLEKLDAEVKVSISIDMPLENIEEG